MKIVILALLIAALSAAGGASKIPAAVNGNIPAGCFGNAAGQDAAPTPIEYEGRYIDTQDTWEIYSELVISQPQGGEYPVEIGIYRLTTFTGTAAVKDDGLLEFTDTEFGVKGDIVITEDSAEFTVTESNWDLVRVGDTFAFPEKLD